MGPSFSEYMIYICYILAACCLPYWIYLDYKIRKNPKYEFTLICTPEGYRRILAQCEVAKLTQAQYFNQAINLMSDKLDFPKPDDVTVH